MSSNGGSRSEADTPSVAIEMTELRRPNSSVASQADSTQIVATPSPPQPINSATARPVAHADGGPAANAHIGRRAEGAPQESRQARLRRRQLQLRRRSPLGCSSFLCLRAPRAACCAGSIVKGFRTLISVCICIHAVAFGISVADIILTALSVELAPFTQVCIDPGSLSFKVLMIALIGRCAWLVCCVLACAGTNPQHLGPHPRAERAVTGVFFAAAIYGVIIVVDGVYNNILLSDNCDTVDAHSTDDPTSDGTEIIGGHSAIDIVYAIIVIVFQLALQLYCMIVAWGVVASQFTTRAPRPMRQLRAANRRTAATNDVAVGELVDVATLEGEPVEVVSLVVGLPSPPRGHARTARREMLSQLLQIDRGNHRTAASTVLSQPQPILTRREAGTEAISKVPVATATRLRSASATDMEEVPEAIALPPTPNADLRSESSAAPPRDVDDSPLETEKDDSAVPTPD